MTINFATFKYGLENYLGKELTNEEMAELCSEALRKLLNETIQEEQNATN